MEETHSTLLLRLKNGTDEAAWRTFNDLYRPMLIRYAEARGLELNDAEDVAQQCVQGVLKQIGEYKHLGSFKTWLRAIAEHKICDVFRAKGREVQADSKMFSEVCDSQDSPEQVWEGQWQKAHLAFCAEKARAEVEDKTYAAFVAYGIEGRPASEVAANLGLTVNQVYVAKHRLLRRIRALLVEMTGAEPAEVLP